MIGIESLEIVIGLIFIYLLFSLFLSILSEILSSIFQIRGKELLFAIEQMLSRGARNLIYNHERVDNARYRSSRLYGTPIWKIYLNRKKKSEKIDLASGKPGDKITNYVLPSHISTENFATILIDLYQDDDTRETLLQEVPYLKKLAENVNDDIALLKKEIEDWYDEVMVYTTEWYKQKLRYILLILGFITAVVFNVDTINIFKTLANDPETRVQVVQQAQTFIESHHLEDGIVVGIPDTLNSDSASADTIASGFALRNFLDRERNKCKGQDSIPCMQAVNDNYPTLVRIDSTYQEMNRLVNDEINLLSTTMGLGWDFSELKNSNSKIRDFFRLFWEQSGFRSIFGWLITALAISLGAPFWFDMLKRVVNIRNELAGRKKGRDKSTPVG